MDCKKKNYSVVDHHFVHWFMSFESFGFEQRPFLNNNRELRKMYFLKGFTHLIHEYQTCFKCVKGMFSEKLNNKTCMKFPFFRFAWFYQPKKLITILQIQRYMYEYVLINLVS